MDHRIFLANLPPATRADLTRLTNWNAGWHLFAHALLIAIMGGFILTGAPGWPLALIAQGVLLAFGFTLMHEASHRTAFRSEPVNDRVAQIVGFILFLPPAWFRYYHFAHHKFTQDPARDPELATPRPNSLGAYLWHVTGIPTWTSQGRALLLNAAGRTRWDYVPAPQRNAVTREARVMVGLYIILAVVSLVQGWTVLIWLWLVPLLIGQPVLRLFLLAEHGQCPQVANMFENSRTTYTARIIRFLSWNMSYHAEHHANPRVPYHQLPQMHDLCHAHLGSTSDGYVQFNRDYVAALPVGAD